MEHTRQPSTWLKSHRHELSCWLLGGVLGALLLKAQDASARQLNHRSDNEWTSTQKASLGNIAVLSENFSDQFFSDPSLQARNKTKFDLQIVSLNVYATDDLVQTTSDARNFVKKIQSSDSDSPGLSAGVDTLEFLASLTGRRAEAGATLQLISVRMGSFTLVPYVNAFAKAHIDVPSWPQAEVYVDQYSGLGLGYSHPLGRSFDLGINLRPGLRAYVRKGFSASDLDIETQSTTASGQDQASDGFTPKLGVFVPVDLAVGYLVSPNIRTHLVLRNAYGGALVHMSGQDDAGRTPSSPPDFPLELNTGLTWRLFDNKIHRLRAASELQDATSISQMDDLWLRWQWAAQYLYTLPFRKQTSFGLNMGLHSGYPGVGVLLDLFLFKLEGAWFAFEGGAAPGQNGVTGKSLRVYSELTF
jgi:hypothetical protein